MNARRCELWDASTSAAVDRHSIDGLGIPSAILMERAALACARAVVELRASEDVVAVCGGGNNGGDGVAIARILHGWGVPARVVLAGVPANAAMTEQLTIARACGVTVEALAEVADPPGAVIVVDALLGTGSRGAPRGAIAAALARIARWAGPRLAVDLPSGVDPDRGSVATDAVVATRTVTFGRSKPGLHVTPGRTHAGEVIVADIGLVAPSEVAIAARIVDPQACAAILRGLPPARHKGDRGHVGFVGGGADTPGAVLLATAAAFRTGAGLCTAASDDAALRALWIAARPELMVAGLGDRPVPSADALVVGPGLTDRGATAHLAALWQGDPRPAIWDASALDHVPADAAPVAPRVITPHPGEAARMLARIDPGAGWSSAVVQGDRLAAARMLARRFSAIVVLKGEGTLVDDGEAIAIAPWGGEGLSTAGSGDALAGAIGALLARGLAPGDAARIGVMLHARAGELALARHMGTMAGDVAEALADARDEVDRDPAAWSIDAPGLPRWSSG